MFLYFEDYSQFVSALTAKGIKNGGRIIKIFAAKQDPRITLKRPNLKVIEVDESEFKPTDVFDFGKRGVFHGDDIEQYIKALGLPAQGGGIIRALFRFANREDLGFCRRGMELEKEGVPVLTHPVREIDGIDEAQKQPELRVPGMHLDIFFEQSLNALEPLVDFDNKEQLVAVREGVNIRLREQIKETDLPQVAANSESGSDLPLS